MPVEHAGTAFYTLGEVARHTQRSRQTIWRWKRAGKIPPGRRYRDRELLFSWEELEAIYAYAHRTTSEEASATLKNQLELFP